MFNNNIPIRVILKKCAIFDVEMRSEKKGFFGQFLGWNMLLVYPTIQKHLSAQFIFIRGVLML